jgi:DNA replication protein DnaC
MFEWNMRTGPGNLAAVASGEMRQPPSPVWYESWPRLLAEYRRVGWNEPRWFTRLERRITVLMLDDIGLDTGTPYRESFLVRHIEWSYSAGRTLILTVNDPPEEWKRVLGERASDRLRDPKQFINVRVTQPSLR